MVQYCENRTDCRRVELLGYFGERFRKEDCEHSCDNCNSTSVSETKDFSSVAQAAVNLVRVLRRDDLTLIDCAKLLLGHKISKMTNVEPPTIEGYGAASGMVRGEVERVLQRLVSENGLMERTVMNRRRFPNSYLDVSW
jgi:bloom syndrome protein